MTRLLDWVVYGMHGALQWLGLLLLPVLFTLLFLPTPAHAQDISTGEETWVWQNPLPQGIPLPAVWGADANNVWIVLLPPGQKPPETGNELVPLTDSTLTVSIRLQIIGDGLYRATYRNFDEVGDYRVIIYAEDLGGLQVQSKTLIVSNGMHTYLPFASR